MFPFKEKEKRHLVEAFCELLIHKAHSFTGSQPRILGLAETVVILVLIDLRREEKISGGKDQRRAWPLRAWHLSYLKELKVWG